MSRTLAMHAADERTVEVPVVRTRLSATVIVPVYNEQDQILTTLRSLLAQTVPFDQIVVGINNSTDASWHRVLEFARHHPTVRVLDFGHVPRRKSEAMNRMWSAYCRAADLVVTVDGDTELRADSLETWQAEFAADPRLGASSARFTMYPDQKSLLIRLQRLEFAQAVETALRRGQANVNPGAGSCYRGSTLVRVQVSDHREGPWLYESETEDFELTQKLRSMGSRTIISPTVRAYTDGMTTLKSLWKQRIKWQQGGIKDLLRYGWTRQTNYSWWMQCRTFLGIGITLVWLPWMVVMATGGGMRFQAFWLLVPVVSAAYNTRLAWFTPHRDWVDLLLAAVWVPQLVYTWLEMAEIVTSWVRVGWERVTGRTQDLWAAQYAAEEGVSDAGFGLGDWGGDGVHRGGGDGGPLLADAAPPVRRR